MTTICTVQVRKETQVCWGHMVQQKLAILKNISQFYLNLEVISNQNKTIINTALINKFTNNSSHMTGSMEIKCFTVCVSRTALEQD